MDEFYGCFLFEQKMVEALSAVHPYQFVFSTKEPGLSGAIGFLEQNAVVLEEYLNEDKNRNYYEEVT